MKRTAQNVFSVILLISLAFFVVVQTSFADDGVKKSAADGVSERVENSSSTDNITWTCAMHPHIRLPKPGKCPICHMDLIPDSNEMTESSGKNELKLSSSAQKLMQIEVSPVERKWVERPVRLFGRIDYDETRLKHITSWVAGRIDRLYVDYTGIGVKRGDHMVYLYSPELLTAQEEFIQAARSFSRLSQSANSTVRKSTQHSIESAREKLHLLGLTDSQISGIQKREQADDRMTIFAPMGGIVVEKHVSEGMYVETGTKIYTIADLSHLWVYLDAYESDLPWIRYGQAVEFNAKAIPGENFTGVVSFVQPFLDEKTRTVKVRVNVENLAGRLKPGMFVTGIIKSRIDSQGEALTPTFSGKFVCPMHPEVVREQAGSCPICGMDLVKAESLPFIGKVEADASQPPLVIPASAPLITGKRAVVYVKESDNAFAGRDVVLGPRAGDYYLVRSGLNEGEQVVTNGSFKIDADLQIRGMKSMMNPTGESASAPQAGHNH